MKKLRKKLKSIDILGLIASIFFAFGLFILFVLYFMTEAIVSDSENASNMTWNVMNLIELSEKGYNVLAFIIILLFALAFSLAGVSIWRYLK